MKRPNAFLFVSIEKARALGIGESLLARLKPHTAYNIHKLKAGRHEAQLRKEKS